MIIKHFWILNHMIKLTACLFDLQTFRNMIIVKLHAAYNRLIGVVWGHWDPIINWIFVMKQVVSLFNRLKFLLNLLLYIYELQSIALPMIIDFVSVCHLRMLIIFRWFFYQSKVYFLRLRQLIDIKLLFQVL